MIFLNFIPRSFSPSLLSVRSLSYCFLFSRRSLYVPGATFAFSIYDFEGNNTVDAIHVGNILRGLNLNPTLAVIEKVGGTKKKSK
jgi:hypothetical protein